MGVDVTKPKPLDTHPGDEIVAWAREQLAIARSILDNPGGGLLFAFSPYLANQAIRHLFLSFVPLVPLLIPLIDDWLISR